MLITKSWIVASLYFVGACQLGASTFQVTVNDTLQNQTGFLAFDFLAGSPAPGNVATITSFTTDATLASASSSGSVTGSLVPGPLTLADTQFFNEWLQGLVYGTSISFVISTGNNISSSGSPDSFSFFLLNDTRNPFATSDPTGADSLFTIDLTGPSTIPDAFTSDFATVTISPSISRTPEPLSLPLVLVGLLLSLVHWPRKWNQCGTTHLRV